jgi:hypothetical protein
VFSYNYLAAGLGELQSGGDPCHRSSDDDHVPFAQNRQPRPMEPNARTLLSGFGRCLACSGRRSQNTGTTGSDNGGHRSTAHAQQKTTPRYSSTVIFSVSHDIWILGSGK